MTLNLINNEIINIFFKFYKKDIKSISYETFQTISKNISKNVEELVNDKDSIKLILQKFSDYEFSFFHVVAKFGNADDLKKTIKIIGVDNLNHVDVNNYSALHHASISGRLDNIKILIDAGADINVQSSNDTRNWYPIHYASKFGFLEIVKEFIEAGINKEVTTSFGLTSLHIACEYGNNEIVEYLIKIRSNIDAETSPENHSLTPLHYAVMINSKVIVEMLCNSGADIYKKTINGKDALILATKRNYSQIVSFLINRGLVDNIEEALVIASTNNYMDSIDIIKIFIEQRDSLFNKSNLLKFSKSINEFMQKINPQNIDDSYLSIIMNYKISAYFLCKISKKIGLIKKKRVYLGDYAESIGLDVLSSNLKKINEIILHKIISKKF